MMTLRVGTRVERRGLARVMLTALRLAWRMQRWELRLVAAGGIALTAVALVLPSLGEAGSGDQRMVVLFLTLAAPVVMGSVLGIGIVAGEIEHGTARISWSLAQGRLHWLWTRFWPVALIGVVVAVPLGAAAARLMDLTSPSDIFMYQMRGPVVALHFLIALAIAGWTGAVVRRVVAGLTVAIVLTTAFFVGTALAVQPWLDQQAVVVPAVERSRQPVISLLEHFHAEVAADGRLVREDLSCGTQAECMEALASLTPAMRIVPGSAYWPLLGLEVLVALVMVVVGMAVTTRLTRRWGPG